MLQPSALGVIMDKRRMRIVSSVENTEGFGSSDLDAENTDEIHKEIKQFMLNCTDKIKYKEIHQMSASYIIERTDINGLDKLIDEGKVERVSSRQMLSVAECEGCDWNLIGDVSHSERIRQKAEQHNMSDNHQIHMQALQCFDIRLNEIVELHKYQHLKNTRNTETIGQPTQSIHLNTVMKQGKMNLLYFNGKAKGHKEIDLEIGCDGIVEAVSEWTDYHGIKDEHEDSCIIRQIIATALLNRIEVTIKVKGTSTVFETLKG